MRTDKNIKSRIKSKNKSKNKTKKVKTKRVFMRGGLRPIESPPQLLNHMTMRRPRLRNLNGRIRRNPTRKPFINNL